MAVHFQFKSSTVKESIPIDGHFISVGNLKEKIIESKQLRRGNFDLVVTNSQTKEDYLDDSTLIPRYTTVLIRRVPGQTPMPIVTAPVPEPDEPKVESESGDVQTVKTGFVGVDASETKYPEDLEWDEFGNDLYAIPESLPSQSGNPVQDALPPSIVDEDSKIKALIETPALDWQRQPADSFGPGRGFGRGMGGRMMGGRGFGRGGLERKTPPQGYICHRCKVPGHFIQHCPTNGDPNYDIKRVKPPTGIPKSMLMATPDGSYALPSGAVAVLKPNEAAFEKEIEGLPSTRSVGDLPPELHCPLCKQVMKDAVLTSKCCFKSFCDKCIREHIIAKSVCVCGATNILADDLLPNKTLRDTINRILESNNSSGEIGGGASQIQDMESRNPQPRAPSPVHSVASKGEQVPPPTQKEEASKVHEVVEEGKPLGAPLQTTEKFRLPKVADASEATHESISVKEPASQGSAPLAEEEVQQKPVSGEAAKKKKKKKARMPIPGVGAAEMQWRAAQDLAAENYMMSMGPAGGYNPYWTGMQPGMDPFMPPYAGGVPYNMGFGLGPMDVPFGGVIPQDPFGGQGCMLPFGPPQRDLANFGMGFNAGPPPLSREEFEARKANVKRKREIERRAESRELPKDRGYGREVSSSGDISSMKFKAKAVPPSSSSDHLHRQRSDRPSPDRRSRDPELPRPSSKKKLDHDNDHNRHRDYRDDHYLDIDHHHHWEHKDERHHQDTDHHHRDLKDERHHRDHLPRSSSSRHHRSESAARPTPEATEPPTKTMSAADKKKASVFSRISFPAEDQAAVSKKRKQSSSSEAPALAPASASGKGLSNGHYEHKATSVSTRKSATPATLDYESSDDDRHFKRRPSRYESSPPVAASTEWEEEPRHSKGSKEREREKERGGYSKHR